MPDKRELNKIITNSPEETVGVGKKIASRLKSGDIIYLYGELGSGKTVLVKGICQGLGVKEDVTSSSFVIATEYKGKILVSHIDLYRLDKGDIAELPIDEYILQDGITLIEWADRINNRYKEGLCIKINIIGTNKREFIFENFRD
ncbi:MAG: tRNA (adenosine(37)-N6)-threonylcarbamoyltransferase complex ATPase subunit type 1 TsaE [Candidatus Stahlbacteria bacterium]|jgi:tRNA threonylcarbamoyladenosine biosynthesis protein TsaE|nr:tRNA (adenosine(37)-N6)-threonylcarbamoyltransferase complex ATPase subunit type 1 TsaE [candidate division WOR-3 bacterium]NOR17786.1 tRNA (adenosine(37)-N6)-threonylcarbamoyltransferase complex ATPase subunit type 1 TsaE [candidate division WOR-3 bacterium]TET59962.1 MAG: tRNA (adenosine(37)-N6)-threonylcarbamoyltransferase complex ATPase subunit type 1 TsaE [Candidatus Stahlbacteria bacterium]